MALCALDRRICDAACDRGRRHGLDVGGLAQGRPRDAQPSQKDQRSRSIRRHDGGGNLSRSEQIGVVHDALEPSGWCELPTHMHAQAEYVRELQGTALVGFGDSMNGAKWSKEFSCCAR